MQRGVRTDSKLTGCRGLCLFCADRKNSKDIVPGHYSHIFFAVHDGIKYKYIEPFMVVVGVRVECVVFCYF